MGWSVKHDYTPGCGMYKSIIDENGRKILDGEWYSAFVGSDDDLIKIAAAPELYDALERLVAHVECGGATNADIEVALDALAKARCES